MDCPSPKETHELQPLGCSGDPKRLLQWLRNKHLCFPSDRRGTQPIGHNKTLSNQTGHYPTYQDVAQHRKAPSDPTEYSWTQQDKVRYNRAQPSTKEYNLTQHDVATKKGKELFEERTTCEENNEQLKRLEAKYLLCGQDSPPISRQDSQVEYIIDGVDYFRRVHELIQSTKKGDAIFISGLSFSSKLDLLLDKPQDDPDHQELGDLLAQKAADGVDVRVLLASGLIASSFPFPKWFPLRRNTLPVMDLRTRIPKRRNVTEAPLARRVALDWTGANLGSNHQKLVLVSHQGKLTALVGSVSLAKGLS